MYLFHVKLYENWIKYFEIPIPGGTTYFEQYKSESTSQYLARVLKQKTENIAPKAGALRYEALECC